MSWLMLGVAGLLEVGWATALKESEGLTRLWPSLLGLGGALVSFVLLAYAVKGLPIGTAYAVWVGIGAVGVAIVGMIWFGDAVTPVRLALLALIILGVAGLKVLS